MREIFPFRKSGIVYLDSAATTHKPAAVLDAEREFYEQRYANIHRGLYGLAEEATTAYEEARKTVAAHINAAPEQVVFTSGTTDAMNLLASTYPLTREDTVILTQLDHHSLFVPWQQAAQRAGATLKVIPVTAEGTLDMEAAERLIGEGCTVLGVPHISNVTGTLQDVERLADLAHMHGGRIVVDGAQAVAHLKVDVKALGVDAYAFSGHKVYGPTGIGALYANFLDELPPYRFGGEMVDTVTANETTFRNPPARFEAGTPPIAQAIGFAAALEWLQSVSHARKNEQLGIQAIQRELENLGFINIIGPRERVGLISFTLDGVHPHDVAQFLDSKRIAVRAGHHCCQPLHDVLGIAASVRVSLGLYNTADDIPKLVAALKECKEAFDV